MSVLDFIRLVWLIQEENWNGFCKRPNWLRLTLLFGEQYGWSSEKGDRNWYDISMYYGDNVFKKARKWSKDKTSGLADDKFNLYWEIGRERDISLSVEMLL